jgi:hypothetical protein
MSLIKFLLAISMFFTLQANALSVTSIDHRDNKVELILATPALSTGNHMGACYQGSGVYTERGRVRSLMKGETFSTITEKTANVDKICLIISAGFEVFATNPLRNVPECHVEIYSVMGGKDNAGQLRASPECGYVGRCPSTDKLGPVYSSTNANCLPCNEPGDQGIVGSGLGC